MKIILKLLFIILIASNCNQTKNKSVNKNKTEVKKNSNELIINIIHNSTKRKDGCFDLNKIKYRISKIDFLFVKKYLINFKTDNNIDLRTYFDENSQYYFYDYKEFDDVLLFTIIQNDEIGYDNFAHYVYDKKTNKIVNVSFIASIGGDGGQYEESVLFYSNS